jgi:LGFP repeat
MSISIRLHNVRCNEERNEASASEEIYILLTSVQFKRTIPGLPSLHNLRVERFGPWEDFDAGESILVDNVFWGLRGVPADVADVGEVVFLISLMEHDNGDPDAYRAAIELVASGSLGATIGEEDDSVRAEALLRSIRDALEGINLPLPLSFDDDHIGTQSLGLKNTDLVAGGFLNKQLRIESDEGDYTLTFRLTRSPFVVFGAIREHWKAQGAEEGVLGLPMGNEAPTFDGAGRAQHFAGGIVSWHGALGAHTVWGLIGQRWLQLGREQFGYPVTDELSTPDGAGRFNHFRALHLPGTPDASIYWHPSTGAHEVYGAIRHHWAGRGWEQSRFGYPAGPEHDFQGGRLQRFQNGALFWHNNAVHEQ